MNPFNKQPQINDVLLQMKIGTKQINREAKNSDKQSMKYMNQAKSQLRKNNQENAKLYLQNAAQKKNQATNFQKMALRNQYMATNLKSLQSGQEVMKSFNQMGNLARNMTPDFQKMAYNINQFEQGMQKMKINQKMMSELMNQQSCSYDSTTNEMLNALKQEIALEQKIKIEEAAQLKEREKKIQSLKSRKNNLQL